MRYLELIGGGGERSRRGKSSAAEADEIARVVTDYFVTGQGRKADADRAETERRLFQARIQHAEELVAVASARLSEQLNLDASIRLEPPPGQLEPLTLVSLDVPTEELIRAAVRQRPDLASRQADINAADFRHKRELVCLPLPTVWVGQQRRLLGSGSNFQVSRWGTSAAGKISTPGCSGPSSTAASANLSLQRQQRAEVNEAIATRVRALNRARDEITSSRAEAIAQRQMVETARAGAGLGGGAGRSRGPYPPPREPRPADRDAQQPPAPGEGPRQPDRGDHYAEPAQFSPFVVLGTPRCSAPTLRRTLPGPPPIANPCNRRSTRGRCP